MIKPTFNKSLKELSSMKTGGSASVCYLPENESELIVIIKQLNGESSKFAVLGNMSNVLIPDKGIEIPVIVTTEMKGVKLKDETDKTVTVYAESGVSFTKLAFEMCKKGYSGLEFAYGIPGTVGGAVYMNAGAYGGEAKDVISKVTVCDKQGNVKEFTKEECDFGYRHSVFADNGMVILGAEFVLTKADADKCVSDAKEIMQKRIDKQPLEYPSCGSTFKRPEGYFAGKLIQDSELMGYSVGGAQVSEKHAGFVINKNNATTEDVLCLMRKVREIVKEKFGVTLEEEIKLLDEKGEVFAL